MKKILFFLFFIGLISLCYARNISDFAYYRPVNISIDTNAVDYNYTFQVRLDTQTLIAEEKMRSDCNDLTISMDPFSNELDRNVSDCNTTNSLIEWKANQAFNKTTDYNTTFRLYYGYSTPSAAPNNLRNVYLFWDNFEDDVNGSFPVGWIQQGPAPVFKVITKTPEEGTNGTKALCNASASDYLNFVKVGVEATYGLKVLFTNFVNKSYAGDARRRYGLLTTNTWNSAYNTKIGDSDYSIAYTTTDLNIQNWYVPNKNDSKHYMFLAADYNTMFCMWDSNNSYISDINEAHCLTYKGTTGTTAGGTFGYSFYDSDNYDNCLDDIIMYSYVNFPPAISLGNETPTGGAGGLSGTLSLRFYDENTLSLLTGNYVYITIDKNSYYTNTGIVDFNILGWSSKNYEITAYDALRPTRTYYIDLINTQDYNIDFVLLRATQGENINFQYYKTDAITNYTSDSNVTIKKGSYYVEAAKFDSLGKATHFLNPNEEGYTWEIKSPSGNETYSEVTVSILEPKAETTFEPINPFSVQVSGIGYDANLNNTSSFQFKAFPNTISTYNIVLDDDTNDLYYARTYSTNWKGNPLTADFQGYLTPKVASEGTTITLFTKKLSDLSSLPGVRVVITRYINGLNTTVEDITTDSKGEALISLSLNTSYTFIIYYNSVLYQTLSITPTSTTIYLYLNIPTTTTPLYVGVPVVNTNFNPSPGVRLTTGTYVNLIQKITVSNTSILSIRIVYANRDWNGVDSNISDNTYTTGVSGGYTNTTSIASLIASFDENKTFITRVFVKIADGNTYLYEATYYYKTSYDLTNIASKGMRKDFGCSENSGEVCPFLLLMALMISIIIIGFLALSSEAFRSIEGAIFILIGIWGLFTYITWIPIGLFLLMAFTGIIAVIGLHRGG